MLKLPHSTWLGYRGTVKPADIGPFLAKHGLNEVTLLGSQSISHGMASELQTLATTDPAAYQRVFSLLYRMASNPGILGQCNHLLYVGTRR